MNPEEQKEIIYQLESAVKHLKEMDKHLKELEKISNKYPQKEEEFLKLLSSKNRIKFLNLTHEIAKVTGRY